MKIDHTAFLEQVFAKNKALYGGFKMELEPTNEPVEDPAPTEPAPDPVEGEPTEEPKELEDEPKTFDLDYVKTLRAESASYRTRLREVEKALEERKSPEEIDTLVNSMRVEREEAERALIVENAALKNDLPKDLQDTLADLAKAGLSKEEIEAKAETLAKFAPKKNEVIDDLGGGINPGSQPEDNTSARDRVRAMRRNRF